MRRPHGFTLLELLVAIALFAVVAGLAYGSLDGLARGSTHLAESAERLAAVQRGMDLIVRDLRQASSRAVRDEGGRMLPALAGHARGIELTRAGHGNALAQPRAELERVGYRRDGDRLERLHWPVLDRAGSTRPRVDALLDRVLSLQWRYLDANGREHGQWPPRAAQAPLPVAVEVQLVLEDYGALRRVVELTVEQP